MPKHECCDDPGALHAFVTTPIECDCYCHDWETYDDED